MDIFDKTCFECSKIITNQYSTSFSMGINAFDKRFRYPVYAIYGFVRYADEIVDTFHAFDKAKLIASFRKETFEAIADGISLNPVLQSFQLTVNNYGIDHEHINAFLCSMEMDIDKTIYHTEGLQAYIYGSAEVVGLMCLRVFCEGDNNLYNSLLPTARALGSAFQKINFLRDIKADFEDLGRTYFPGINFHNFTEEDKRRIETDIKTEFDVAYLGIKQLPKGSRLGVYIAYIYYLQLFKKIKKTPAKKILNKRIRVANWFKLTLYCKAVLKQKLQLI